WGAGVPDSLYDAHAQAIASKTESGLSVTVNDALVAWGIQCAIAVAVAGTSRAARHVLVTHGCRVILAFKNRSAIPIRPRACQVFRACHARPLAWIVAADAVRADTFGACVAKTVTTILLTIRWTCSSELESRDTIVRLIAIEPVSAALRGRAIRVET